MRGLAAANLGLIAVWALVALELRRGYVNAIRESLKRHGLDAEQTTSTVLDRSTTEVLAGAPGEPATRRSSSTPSTCWSGTTAHPAHPALRLAARPRVPRGEAAGASASSTRRATARWRPAPSSCCTTRTSRRAPPPSPTSPTTRTSIPCAPSASLGDFAECSVRAGMVSFLARPGRSQNLEAARALLDAMVAEPDPEGRAARLEAARLTAVLPAGFGRAIGRLLRDDEVEVARLAIRAVGAKKRAEFVPELLARLGHPQLSDDAERSLGGLGDAALPPLRDLLFDPAASLEVKREIPAVLVRLGTPEAQRALMESLLHHDPTLRRPRHRLPRSACAGGSPQLHLEAELLETVLAAEITGHYRSHQVLERLGRELQRRRLRPRGPAPFHGGGARAHLRPAGPARARATTSRARTGASAREDARTRANALELLDNVLKPPLRRLVVPLVDPHVSVARAGRSWPCACWARRSPRARRRWRCSRPAATPGCARARRASSRASTCGLSSRDLARWTEDPDPLLREAARAARRQLQEGAWPGARARRRPSRKAPTGWGSAER